MARVEIVKSLDQEINKKFKHKSVEILQYLKSLEENPHKGKLLTSVAGIVIKKLKYEGFRFYFIADGHKLKFLSKKELTDLLLMFVRMSDKKSQQKVIDEIREVLIKMGPDGFE